MMMLHIVDSWDDHLFSLRAGLIDCMICGNSELHGRDKRTHTRAPHITHSQICRHICIFRSHAMQSHVQPVCNAQHVRFNQCTLASGLRCEFVRSDHCNSMHTRGALWPGHSYRFWRRCVRTFGADSKTRQHAKFGANILRMKYAQNCYRLSAQMMFSTFYRFTISRKLSPLEKAKREIVKYEPLAQHNPQCTTPLCYISRNMHAESVSMRAGKPWNASTKCGKCMCHRRPT